MERHQQPQRECKSPLLSMNNTKLRSYYVLGLSWVIITAPNPFSRPAVCIKRIFSTLLIRTGLHLFRFTVIHLFTKKSSPSSFDFRSPFFFQSVALFFFSQWTNQSLCRKCQREISNPLKVSDIQLGQYKIPVTACYSGPSQTLPSCSFQDFRIL